MIDTAAAYLEFITWAFHSARDELLQGPLVPWSDAFNEAQKRLADELMYSVWRPLP